MTIVLNIGSLLKISTKLQNEREKGLKKFGLVQDVDLHFEIYKKEGRIFNF